MSHKDLNLANGIFIFEGYSIRPEVGGKPFDKLIYFYFDTF